LQSQILLQIIQGLRTADLSSNISKKFDRVIMVATSYGSLHGRELAISHPTDAADAYILTATAWNLQGITTIVRTITTGSASEYDPANLGDLPPAYMALDSAGLKDVLYPLDGDFDPDLLAFDEQSSHTFSVGELASPKQNVTSNFTGPVFILTGRNDAIVCDAQGNNTAHVADCGVGKSSPLGQTAPAYPQSRFGEYVPARTGHNLLFGYSAPEVFGAAHAFLELNGF
jgi:pimeloyl-ACP methyl ester carboxylesterase